MNRFVVENDYRDIVVSAVGDERVFVGLTFSANADKAPDSWVRVRLRPVLLQERRYAQFQYFTLKKCVTKNHEGDELRAVLDDLFALPFRQIHLQTIDEDLYVKITRKGKTLMNRVRKTTEAQPSLSHNREKEYLLNESNSTELLSALGFTDSEGRLRPTMQAKFKQVHEFLRIIEQALPAPSEGESPLRILDCGCGKAYLTFAAYHYLKVLKGRPVSLIGIDVHEETIRKCAEVRNALGYSDVDFRPERILEYSPDHKPNLVMSLHACDTATDEAIAKGILWGSEVILAAPCCQHELAHQLKESTFQPLLRHGILRERLADILTDAFRALVLRINGYRTQVSEFISSEETSRNIMIRAEMGLSPGCADSIAEYQRLKDFWNVEPALDRLLKGLTLLH